jgi:hypothetical protein
MKSVLSVGQIWLRKRYAESEIAVALGAMSCNRLSTGGEPSSYVTLSAETTPKWLDVEPQPMAAHKFKAGQLVTLHSKRHGVFAEQFEVMRLLPSSGGDFQYRIRSVRDRHERVVLESELAASRTP